MNTFYVSIGSNVDPEKNVPACIERLRGLFKDIRISPVYETPPFGPAGNVNFWNAACRIRTALDETQMRSEMQKLETVFGRRHDENDKFAPRTLDLDILPKEGYQKQAFVIVPLADIDPEGHDPQTQKTFMELARGLHYDAAKFRKIFEDNSEEN